MADSNAALISPRRWALLESALIFLLFFIDGGAAAPHVNESHYLAKAKHYWDASYCPGDLFLDSADPHLAFYWAFGWLTLLLPLSAVAWIGRIVAWSLLAAGWFRLSTSVLTARWAPLFSAALWVTLLRDGNRNFAGEWVVGGIEAKCIAYGFFLFGLAAMARGDWRRPWIWFGAASAFHVLVGAWAVIAAGCVWLTEPRGDRAPLRVLVPGLVIGGLTSLVGVVPSLALEWNVDAELTAEAARIYVFDRLPHHLAPLSLAAGERDFRLAYLAGMIAAYVALTAWFWQSQRRGYSGVSAEFSSSQAAQRVVRFAAFALAGAMAGLAIEYFLRDDPLLAARLLRYYWFRQVDVALPLAISLLGSAWIAWMLRQGAAWRRVVALAVIIWPIYFLGSVTYARWQSNLPPALKQVENAVAWQKACRWIDEHAPADARFIIPRWGHAFKWYAARADVASYKDVPQDPASVVAWRDRLRKLYPTINARDERGRKIMLDSPEVLGTPQVLELAKRYGATHVIARSSPRLDLPVLFETEVPPGADVSGYIVYDTGASPVSEP
jgi:hypothetical protein